MPIPCGLSGFRIPSGKSLEAFGASMVIRDFRAEDADELVPMWRESFEFGVGVKDPHLLAEQARYLFTEVVPNNVVRVARLDDRIVGFIAASERSIAQLYVRRGFQGRGIGSQLLDWAKSRSAGTLWLYTFARNAGACAFYEKHGFKPVARGHEPTWKLDDVRYEWRAGESTA
jgi:ribosomal protein S18 acetylase RimI-like enzyme